MKRTLICFMMIIMVLSLVACRKNKQEAEHEHGHEHGATVHLRIGLAVQEGEPQYTAVQQFVTEVEAKSNGEIELDILGSGQLGSDTAMLESLVKDEGKLDIAISNISNFITYEPKMNISGLPFVFADYDEARNFMQGDIQAETERHLINHNMRVLTHYTDGFHCLISADKRVNNAKDLQGVMLATEGGSMSAIAMKAMGAMTKTVNDGELMDALRQGRCDGYEGPLSDIYNRHIYQPQYYLVVTNHCYSASCFVIANSVWNGLSKEHQEIIEKAAVSSSNKNYELARQRDEAILRKMESAGVRICYPDLETFWEKSQPVAKSHSTVYGDLSGKLIAWKNRQ